MQFAVGENFINSDQTGADNDQHLFTSELGKCPGRFWRNIIEQTEASNIDIRPDQIYRQPLGFISLVVKIKYFIKNTAW